MYWGLKPGFPAAALGSLVPGNAIGTVVARPWYVCSNPENGRSTRTLVYCASTIDAADEAPLPDISPPSP